MEISWKLNELWAWKDNIILPNNIYYTCLSILLATFKGAVGSADLKISKSALLSLNHHNFSNTKPIYTE